MKRMRIPFTDFDGQLAWTRHGQVWAGWKITKPAPYGESALKDKHAAKDMHRMLWRSLGGETLSQGLTTNIDPVATVQRMLASRPEEEWHLIPGAVDEAEATLESLQDVVLGERTFWLWLPLRNDGWERVKEPARAATRRVFDHVAAPVDGRTDAERLFRRSQAEHLRQLIPPVLEPRPVTVAEQLWVWSHATSRGLWTTPVDLEVAGSLPDTHSSGCAIVEPILDEGGRSDSDSRLPANPLNHRYLKVTDPAAEDLGQPPSYQSLMAITDFPAGGMPFPGSEYLGNIDHSGVLVDWAVRTYAKSRDKTLRETQKAVRNLNDQYVQREGAHNTGQHELDHAGALLNEYQQIFTNDRNEVEIQHATVLAVSGPTPDAAQDAAKALSTYLRQADIKVDRPAGGQQALWWAMNHGVPTSREVKHYYQRTTASDFARAVPFISSQVGDNDGHYVFDNISSPTMLTPIHLALAIYPSLGATSSCGIGGVMGSGKSYLAKALTGYLVDDGAQAWVVDRSKEGEWARMARTVEGHQVVELAETSLHGGPEWSMDPIRVFGPAEGSGVLLTFLVSLMQVGINTDDGIVLATVLTPEYLEARGLQSTGAVMEHLAGGGCDLPGAERVGRHMRTHAARPRARVIFDESLPPISLTASVTVMRTDGLSLPSREELSSESRMRTLGPDKLFGRAYYALIAATSHASFFARRDIFSLFVSDEAHGLMVSPEAEQSTTEMVRECRRGNGAVILASQVPAIDFGGELSELLAVRVAMRHDSKKLARGTLEWMGLDPQDPSFEAKAERLVKDTSPQDPRTKTTAPHRRGEGLVRDVRGAIAWGRVRKPANPARAAALESGPRETGLVESS